MFTVIFILEKMFVMVFLLSELIPLSLLADFVMKKREQKELVLDEKVNN